jgi:SAM-dependent methyltransferase
MLNRISWRWTVALAVFITSLLLSRRIILLGNISFDGLWRHLTISLITILIWGAITFQRPTAGLLILLSPAFGAAVATGVLGIIHTRISSTDLALGLALICMSINYGVTALYRIPSSHGTWTRSLQSPMVIVPTATVAMLLCSWSSDFRQIGLFAAIGLSAAAGFAGLVLPRISLSAAKRPWRKVPALVVVVLLAAGIGRLRIETNIVMLTAAGLGAILILLAILLVHVELVTAIMIPILLSTVLALGAFGLAGIAISRINGVCILFLLGTAIDYSVNILCGRLEAFRGRKSNAYATVNLSFQLAACALAPMLFSNMQPAGILGLIAIASSFIAAFLLLPTIADWLLPSDAHRPVPSLGRGGAKSLYRYLEVDAEQYVSWKLRLDPIFKGIDSVVPPTGRILDAGCGYGQMSNTLALQSSQRSLVGVDRDERKIQVAKSAARTVANVRFVLGDLLEWDYPQVDCVLLIDVLHYWTAEKQRQLIAKAAGCLSENGTLIFREGLRSSSWGHRVVHLGERWSTWTGQNRRGDGLYFQDRQFYLSNFQRHGLSLRKEVGEWGPGSNSVLVFGRRGGA